MEQKVVSYKAKCNVRKSFGLASRQCDMSQWQNPSSAALQDGKGAARFRNQCCTHVATEITIIRGIIAVTW